MKVRLILTIALALLLQGCGGWLAENIRYWPTPCPPCSGCSVPEVR
jgi:hypothetical protein